MDKTKAVEKNSDGNAGKAKEKASHVENASVVEHNTYAVGDESKVKTQIDETTVYLEDLQKPR